MVEVIERETVNEAIEATVNYILDNGEKIFTQTAAPGSNPKPRSLENAALGATGMAPAGSAPVPKEKVCVAGAAWRVMERRRIAGTDFTTRGRGGDRRAATRAITQLLSFGMNF